MSITLAANARPSVIPPVPSCAALLDAVGAGPKDRVLVLGRAGADALAASLRRGCRSGTALAAPTGHPDPADVVVAPAVGTEQAGQAVADCARRALLPGGRLALRLVGEGTAALARALVARLRGHGFERVLLRGQDGGTLLTCRRAVPAGAR